MSDSQEKVTQALAITDMVVSVLIEIFRIVQEKRSTLKEIQARGGDISEADWLNTDTNFDVAYINFLEELELA